MVTLTAKRTIQWLSPSPLWRIRTGWAGRPDPEADNRPVILRFGHDAFVEELLAMLNHAPWRFSEWIARTETWRTPMRSPEPVVRTVPESRAPRPYNGTRLLQRGDVAERAPLRAAHAARFTLADEAPETPIKLYQAAHQRHYVVTASLTSTKAGYPDYTIDAARSERATIVVRALKKREGSNATWDEYAFVTTPVGPAWRLAGEHTSDDGDVATRRLVPGEEQLGAFAVSYVDDCDERHRLLGGMVPVGRREEWLKAPQVLSGVDPVLAHPVPAEPEGSAHLREVFLSDVVEPWKALVEQAEGVHRAGPVSSDSRRPPSFFFSDWLAMKDDTGPEPTEAELDELRMIRSSRDRIQTGSWYVLLDLANYLEEHLPRIWEAANGGTPSPQLEADEQAIITRLTNASLSTELQIALALENLFMAGPDLPSGLWDKLTELWELEERLELDRWPSRDEDFSEGAQREIVEIEPGHEFRPILDEALALRSDPWYTVLDLLVLLESVTTTPSRRSRLRDYALDLPQAGLTSLEQDLIAALETLEPVDVLRDDLEVPFGSQQLGVDLSDRPLTIVTSLLDALVAVKDHEGGLESVDRAYERVALPVEEILDANGDPLPSGARPRAIDARWPDFLFPLADPDPYLEEGQATPLPRAAGEPGGGFERLRQAIDGLAADIDTLVARATGSTASGDVPVRAAFTDPIPWLDQRDARFVVRCVFERPWCGEIFPPLVSRPTRQFELAPFFDPDAPARPLRIQLPVDISPANLRKFKKNAGFVISDMLCGKIKKIRKLTLADLVLEVLPWPFHKDLPKAGPTGPCLTNGERLGMVCSLSIPIVTLCALILLFIIVSLFDYFFRWIPYLFMCFPLGLKGKD